MLAFNNLGNGTDGSALGIGGCPFNMDKLQKDYVDGAITPTKIINFGSGGPTTEVKMDVTALGDANGDQILEVLAVSGFFETATLNLRVSNLHRMGGPKASRVWVVIPNNIVVPKLVQKLCQGANDKITISSLANIDGGGTKDQLRIVQTAEFFTCFIEFVDPISYGFLTVFAFSYVKVKLTQVDIKQISESGKNVDAGKYVYEYDFNAGSGAKGA